MKTRLTIAMGVMAAALFLVVPSAAPKGHSGGGGSGGVLGAVCAADFGGEETCSISGGGIVAGTQYDVSGTDTCGNFLYKNTQTADSTGHLNVNVADLSNNAGECTPIFTVATHGRRSTTLGTVSAVDTDL